MKASDRSILIGLIILGLLAAFWFLLLAPKREDAAALETQVEDLQAEVTAQEEIAAAAEQAQDDYSRNYERLIVLGKAAPADGDTPSLLAQFTELSQASGTDFATLTTAEADVAEVPAAAQTTTDQNADAAAAGTEAAPAVPVAGAPAPATEASAATLPLGATVGPAGLGVLPYSLAFSGGFFEIADLLRGIDGQIGADGTTTKVGGRLVTINGFTLAPAGTGRDLAAEVSITTYVLPDSQGLTAGATTEAPPASVPTPATSMPTSTTPAP